MKLRYDRGENRWRLYYRNKFRNGIVGEDGDSEMEVDDEENIEFDCQLNDNISFMNLLIDDNLVYVDSNEDDIPNNLVLYENSYYNIINDSFNPKKQYIKLNDNFRKI